MVALCLAGVGFLGGSGGGYTPEIVIWDINGA